MPLYRVYIGDPADTDFHPERTEEFAVNRPRALSRDFPPSAMGLFFRVVKASQEDNMEGGQSDWNSYFVKVSAAELISWLPFCYLSGIPEQTPAIQWLRSRPAEEKLLVIATEEV